MEHLPIIIFIGSSIGYFTTLSWMFVNVLRKKHNKLELLQIELNKGEQNK
jgi:hypothetical protein